MTDTGWQRATVALCLLAAIDQDCIVAMKAHGRSAKRLPMFRSKP